MVILYSGSLKPESATTYRRKALQRLGQETEGIDADSYAQTSSLLGKVLFRLSVGPHIARYNRDLIERATKLNPDVFWADKDLLVTPQTLRQLKRRGIITVSYMSYNPFGPRNDPGWRLHLETIPFFDLHVVPRQTSVADYKQRGAERVIATRFAYEPTVHFPPPLQIMDFQRLREVSFIGSPYDHRADIFSTLSRLGFPLSISGNARAWKRDLPAHAFSKHFVDGELFGVQYREAIWHSKINLSFVTHSNVDEIAHKSLEIAASGGFLLAERSEGHMKIFEENSEAVFFSSIEELRDKINTYLPNKEAREEIASSGYKRAIKSGYSNDAQLLPVINEINLIKSLHAGA